jgi:hypothetical protein
MLFQSTRRPVLLGALVLGIATTAHAQDERLIYARPGLPVKVAVAPVIDRERQAIRVSLRF